jgi:hypothetical protein
VCLDGGNLQDSNMIAPQLKPVQEWNLDYVRQLQASESEWLDFKQSKWLTPDEGFSNRLSTYISAFANYSGGYLVIGCIDPKPDQLIEPDEGVDFSMKNGLQGWLEDKIHALVDPPISRLGVHLIPLAEGANRGIVVIRIEPSADAPHQARDKIFYQRVGSKLKGLSTQHIHDIRNRQRNPDVVVTLKLNLWQYDDHDNPRSNLLWTIDNTSNVLCRHFGIKIKAPTQFQGQGLFYPKPHYLSQDPDHEDLKYFTLSANNAGASPLFPKSQLHGKIPVHFPVKYEKGWRTPAEFEVIAYADSAEAKHFSINQFEVTNIRICPPG